MSTEVTNPWYVVNVQRLDPDTVARVMRQVEASDGVDQLAYREAEIDSLWSLAHMAVRAGRPGADDVLDLLWLAHDSVGAGQREEALAALGSVRDYPGLDHLNDPA